MKKTILFFSEAVTVAHVARLYKLASSLDKEHYDVHFAVEDRYSYVFIDDSITIHRIKSIAHKEFVRRVQRAAPMYKIEELIDYVAADTEVIKRVKPEIVIGDMRQSLCVSTRLTNTVYAALTNAYWSKYIHNYSFIVPELRQLNMNGLPLISVWLPIYFYFFFKNQEKPLNALRRHFNLPIFEHCLDGWNFGDHKLYSDPEALFDTSVMPDNHHFLGSINWEPDVDFPQWWGELSDTKKTAYVSLGSSGDKSFLPKIISELLKEDFQVIASGIHASEEKSLPEHKSVFSAPLMPGSAAAARSELVISNGGSPTSYQSLLSGAPVIGIPTNLDQLMSMKFIEKGGFGKILRPRDIGSAEHTDILKTIQAGGYKEKALAMGKVLSTIYPEQNFANFLDTVLKN